MKTRQKKTIQKFIKMIFRMSHIDRWNLMYNLIDENLSQHSFECAIIANYLANIGNLYLNKCYNVEEITLCALFHDVPEVIIGDIATPIKHSTKKIEKIFHHMEREAISSLCDELPRAIKDKYVSYLTQNGLKDEEKVIIKAADKICAYAKAMRECRFGNSDYAKVQYELEQELFLMDLDEIEYIFHKGDE